MKKNHSKCLANSGNNICDKDGVYFPECDMEYRKAIKKGHEFPLYKGKTVRLDYG